MIWRIKLAMIALAMVLPTAEGHGHDNPHTHEEIEEIALPARRK